MYCGIYNICRSKMDDQNRAGARKGDTEVYNCEMHILCMKCHYHLKMDWGKFKGVHSEA